MQRALIVISTIAILVTAPNCQKPDVTFSAFDERLRYAGRIDSASSEGMILISSAASVTMAIGGNTCTLLIKNDAANGQHNYFSVEIDGVDQGRYRIDGNAIENLELTLPRDTAQHRITLFKATEPGVGHITFCGVQCQALYALPEMNTPKIEFIGNSITNGMSAYLDEIPCRAGVWYDQHNAYCTYGAHVARWLNAEYILSAVSGCGIYRHWDVDHPTLPELYEQTYLDRDTAHRWNFASWIPDIVSISLGTNDIYDGDGVTPRDPFDAERFVTEYNRFIQRIYFLYPDVQVVLLSSPMLSGEKAAIILECLQRVKAHFDMLDKPNAVRLFVFDAFTPNGCGGHPDCIDHEHMAEEVLPLFRELLANKGM